MASKFDGWLLTMRGSHPNDIWSFNHVILRGQMANYICYISTFRRPMDTKLGKIVNYVERFLPLKPQNPLITWPTWHQVSTFTRLMATKLSSVLIFGRRFSMQTLKSSLTSCLFLQLQGDIFSKFLCYFHVVAFHNARQALFPWVTYFNHVSDKIFAEFNFLWNYGPSF